MPIDWKNLSSGGTKTPTRTGGGVIDWKNITKEEVPTEPIVESVAEQPEVIEPPKQESGLSRFIKGLVTDLAKSSYGNVATQARASGIGLYGLGKAGIAKARGDDKGARRAIFEAYKKGEEGIKLPFTEERLKPTASIRGTIGRGLETGSTFVGGGGVKALATSGIKTGAKTGVKAGLKTLAKQGAKEGARVGGIYGGATALQDENAGVKDIAKGVLSGTAAGLVTGVAASPLALALGKIRVGAGARKSTQPISETVSRKTKTPQKFTSLEDAGFILGSQKKPLGQGGKLKERGFVQTVRQSPLSTKEVKRGVAGEYAVETDRVNLQRAQTRIQQGTDEAENFVLNEINPSKEHTVTGIELIKKFQNDKNYDRAIRIVDDLAEKLTKQGQSIQAASLYNKLSPEGVLLYAKKKINKLNKDRAFPQFTKERVLDEQEAQNLSELARRSQEATGEFKAEAEQELAQTLSLLDRSSIGKKLSSTQTIAQLLNPKTLLTRNPAGNEIFYRLERLNKYIVTPIDVARSALTGNDRTITFRTAGQGGYWNGWLKGLKAGWKGVNPAGITSQYDIQAPAFRGKWNPMTYLEKTLGATIKSFDYAAYNRAKNQTIGELATLRAINEGIRGKARKQVIQRYIKEADTNILQIADDYGKYVTFQDDNALSKGLQSTKKTFNKISIPGLRGEFGLGDLVVKYPRTPGALVMRGLEYSPAGFLRSAGLIAKAMSKGKAVNTREVTMALSRAITGSLGFSGLGYFLADKGIITGRPEEDKDIRVLQQEVGGGQFRVNMSALRRWVTSGFSPQAAETQSGDRMISYDWAQPVALMISLGANANQNVKEQKGATKNISTTVGESLEGGLETIVEQPVLQGIARLFQGYDPASTVSRTLKEALASFTPTLLNQIRQYRNNRKPETYDPDVLKEAINKVKAKTPKLAEGLPQQVNVFGEPKETFKGGSNTLFNVFLNPAFTGKYEPTDVAKEVIDLYKRTGETKQAPTLMDKKQTVNGQRVALTPDQYTRVQEYVGKATVSEFTKLILSSRYKNLSDEDRIKEMSNIISDIRSAARIEILGNKPKTIDKNVKGIINKY